MKSTLLNQHQTKAMALSVLILALALGFLWLSQGVKVALNNTVTVREVALALPPPPPPPPTAMQVEANTPINLQGSGQGPTLQMLDITKVEIAIAKPDTPSLNSTQPEWQALEVNWDAFSLDDLDTLPSLLTPLRLTLPKSLTRKGITQVLIKLEIVVDEQGQLELIRVVQNPYPELKPEIDKMVRSSRFSAPKKGDQNVRAKFIWPIEIKG